MLKEISEVLGDPAVAMQKYGRTKSEALAHLTSRYYTLIPHIFGRTTPPVINTLEKLKREAELVESLGEMGITNEIITNVQALFLGETYYVQVANLQKAGQKINLLDRHFDSLQLEECQPSACKKNIHITLTFSSSPFLRRVSPFGEILKVHTWFHPQLV